MGRGESIRGKAVHLVSDLTTVYFNPISDKLSENEIKAKNDPLDPITADSVEGPDTSSFSAFLYSLLSPIESGSTSKHDDKNENKEEITEPLADRKIKGSSGKKTLFSKGKQTLGKAFNQAARLGGYRKQASERTSNNGNDLKADENEGVVMQTFNKEPVPLENLPKVSESSLLLSEQTRNSLYYALPVLVQGRNWVLLYSTWRNGISLSTLYRRSQLFPGLTLLVVGDRKGAVFGGLVEAPLRPLPI